nr:RNA-directed DNA polymerase, eukaryota, reverse transcriptase zinc-binding domain protein [Tanacetum cinerariifolium]
MEENTSYKPLPLGGPPSQVTIQSDFFFNKDLGYLRYGSKGGRPALSISKIKVAYYPNVGLEQMVPDQMWIEEECKHTSVGDRRAVRTHMRILSVVRIEVFSMYGYDYMKKIVLCRADLNEHIIAKRAFKYMYQSDFEDLYLLNLQGHLNHLPPKEKKILTTAMIMWFNEIHKFSDGTLHQIDEALDYRVKEFKVNRMNSGLNTRFWTRKDVDRSKEFMLAIQKWLKIRRIFRNLESFVVGRLKDPQHNFRNSDACFYDQEKCGHAGPKGEIVTIMKSTLKTLLPRVMSSIEIPSITCPSCIARVESNDHIFFGCDTAIGIWRLIRVWIDVSMPSFSSCSEWFEWIEDWRATKDFKDRMWTCLSRNILMILNEITDCCGFEIAGCYHEIPDNHSLLWSRLIAEVLYQARFLPLLPKRKEKATT